MGLDEERVGEETQAPARRLDGRAGRGVAPLRVRTDLRVGVNRRSSGLAHELGKRPLGRPRPHDEPAGHARERFGERLEALAEKAKASRAHVRVGRMVFVEDEHGDDAVGIPRGAGQGGVVARAQVAAEPVDQGRHGGAGITEDC